MATKATLNINGLAQYIESIVQAGKDIDAAAQHALMAGGEILKDEMVALVPVDEANLQSHIVIDGPHQDGNFNYIEVGVIGADAETTTYGNVQEFGSPSKNIPAQPYIRPATDNKRAAAMRAIRESLKAEGLAD